MKKTWNEFFCDSLVEELSRLGVTRFFVAPGSRSTPLVQAIHANAKTQAFVHFDERGLAFLALGEAKRTGKPAALVTTSGTAVAHLLPAVVEASLSHIPLVLLTADRPAELLRTGANQAIDQKAIFGSHVRDYLELPAPSPSDPIEAVLTAVDEMLAQATGVLPGPVHINCPFREPLYSQEFSRVDIQPSAGYLMWLDSRKPWARVAPRKVESSIAEALDELKLARRGLITFGAHSEFVPEIFEKLPWPAFVDIHAGLKPHPNVIDYSELLLETPPELQPDLILHFGGPPTSKQALELHRRFTGKLVQVHPYPERSDPYHRRKLLVTMSARSFSEALPSLPPSGLDLKPQAQEITRKLSRFFETNERLSEAWLASFLAASIEGDLYLGSSLTIRNFDRYAATSDRIGRVYSNRGASGIDGNIATALGCAGEGPGSVMTAVIGDLAALHDLNSLALLKESAQEARQESKKTLRLIVVNNDGGGIFSFLQVAKENPAFEKFWGTPHGLNFEKLAAAFDLPYTSVRSRSQLKSAVGRRARTEIIEVFTTRAENIDESARILEALRAAT